MHQIASALSSCAPEIQRVKTTAQTGSMTIYFDRDQSNLNTTFTTLQEMGIIAIASNTVANSSVSAQVKGVMATVNQRVNRLTEGSVDLRFLVPLMLAVLALRRLITKEAGGMKSAPWYVLAWYAFDSFMKLNTALEDKLAAPPTPHNSGGETAALKPGEGNR